MDPEVESNQVRRVKKLRRSRDNSSVTTILFALEQVAKGADNLMPLILTAAEAHATVGEISDTLRKVFGEHREHH